VKIKEMKAAGIEPLILDAGDLFFSTKNLNASNRNSETFRAKSMLEGYEKVGCDVINVGQYEILNGLNFLKSMEKKTVIPFLSSNLKNSKTGELLFDPYLILERGDLKVGVVGATDLLPDTCLSIVADDFVESCNRYAKELDGEVDLVVALINASRASQNGLVDKMPDVDFIVTSGSTNMSRSNSPQKENGPFIYSCGKQGKYLLSVTVDLKENDTPFINISSEEKKIKSIQKRFDRLQKKDPDKTLESIYEDQENVLNLIKKYREDLKTSESVVASAVNTLKFETIALNKKVGDDEGLLTFINSSVQQCNALGPKKAKGSNSKRKKLSKEKPDPHKGHNH
tara:strand:+ start:1973 stop:2995 length:1023 start_codon:yes stop_codon:yes gene_type:complete